MGRFLTVAALLDGGAARRNATGNDRALEGSGTGRYFPPMIHPVRKRGGFVCPGAFDWLFVVGTSVYFLAISGLLAAGAGGAAGASEIYNSQEETIPLSSPAQALAGMHLPAGFQATVFAAEPDVEQPIGMTTDTRGRLWMAENFTYAEQAKNFDTHLQDRIVILEDTNHDGQFDRRKVFWDQAEKLTSVAVGFGGVFALCPPRFLFIPDRNGDDVPDGPAEVLLDGWNDDSVRHNIANGLKFGPDGWLYGRHGIQATSLVGKPGSAREGRVALNCAIWRFHPVTHVFEVVCRGTTNPWGHDWDEAGELFFINTVIGHLWHAIPGAYFKRMYGEHDDPWLYELIDQTADHYHWDRRESWSDIHKLGVTPTTSRAGGGHAHSGLMIYQGDNWPAKYHNTIFMINLHGRRLNNDIPERAGATYTAHHGRDFMTMDDPWFRGLDLLGGPDGGVFLNDWTDIGECHEADGVHRTSGRIYKITYGTPARPWTGDVREMNDEQLVQLQLEPNEWQVRKARQVLEERAAAGADMAAAHATLRRLYPEQGDWRSQLRLLWCLYVTGGADEAWLRDQLRDPNEHIRVWAARLLADTHAPDPEARATFVRMATEDPSGLVLTYLASDLQRMPQEARWPLAEALAARNEFAADPVYPLMLWYGIEPAVPQDRKQAVDLAGKTAIPKLREFITRRLTEDLAEKPAAVDRILQQAVASRDASFQLDVLRGMNDASRGWSRAEPPRAWPAAFAIFEKSPNPEIPKLAAELALVFGNGRAAEQLKETLSNAQADPVVRRRALHALVQTRAKDLFPLIQPLLENKELAPDAIRALAALGDPAAAGLLIKTYDQLPDDEAKMEAINALSSRESDAEALLRAVREKRLPRGAVGALAIRQLRAFHEPAIDEALVELWPEYRQITREKAAEIARFKQELSSAVIDRADLEHGRELFQQVCGVCHTLYGQGGQVGPDLTGADRHNLAYLLENIVDPSAIVPENYRVSVITLKDDRVITGIILSRGTRTMTIQTPTERLTVENDQVESVENSSFSMMPDGLLEALRPDQVRDLIGYLMSSGPRP